MLYHHNSAPYQQAASDAAHHGRSKLNTIIERGRGRAADVIAAVQASNPVDRIVRGAALKFAPDGNQIRVRLGDEVEPMHDHALAQAASRVGLPLTYAQHLREDERREWGPDLLAFNLQALYGKLPAETRLLTRSVNGNTMAVLSDRFRRIDSRQIVDSFAKACRGVGALPIEGYRTDVKIAIKAILPEVFEPVPNEIMAFGIVLENSDFGAGALSLRVFALRLWCTNYAITDESLREVHLGSRLSDDIAWSEKTHSLDTARMSSAISDIVKSQLSIDRINGVQDVIRRADAEKVDARQVGALLKKYLHKGEVDRAIEAFEGPDVELLPAGNTMWRASNAISWLAGMTTEPERKLELMKAAGAVMGRAA